MRSRRILILIVAIISALFVYDIISDGKHVHSIVADVSDEVDKFANHHPANPDTPRPPVLEDDAEAPPPPPPPPPPAADRPEEPEDGKPHPKYKPSPVHNPPPIRDPFALLATSTPPPIPAWNVARDNLHVEYGLDYAPPLLVGFGRNWPMLLQTVVSYITAGWPAEQIYVIENTGVQFSNQKGKLSLQNPFYLNHKHLKKLGVNIVQAPVLMTFAQMQNFFINLAHINRWPYYFWSHMDVLALSFEDGKEGLTPPSTDPGYKTIYELSLRALNDTLESDDRWGLRFFAYDHLALVNREAYDDVGGWDVMIPFYIGDCDMHSRLSMAGWSQKDYSAGIITDVALALDDLQALYRVPGVKPSFTDPSPPDEKEAKKKKKEKKERKKQKGRRDSDEPLPPPSPPDEKDPEEEKRTKEELKKAEEDKKKEEDGPRAQWRALQKVADDMFHHKHDNKSPLGRNTWQQGQTGGFGEPYYYPNEGFREAVDIITEAGREVYRRKWGHRDCDLLTGAGLKLWDQWKVEKDWS
ncbi:hypothetical protein ACHAQH_003246 [Verticillium albo-atrum]